MQDLGFVEHGVGFLVQVVGEGVAGESVGTFVVFSGVVGEGVAGESVGTFVAFSGVVGEGVAGESVGTLVFFSREG